MILNLEKLYEESTKFELLRAGVYKAKVYSYELQTSKTGKPMVCWNFELENGRRFYNYTMLDNKVGQEIFAQTVVNAGYKGELKKFDVSKFFETQELVDNNIIVVLGVRDSEQVEGEKENYIKYTKKVSK